MIREYNYIPMDSASFTPQRIKVLGLFNALVYISV